MRAVAGFAAAALGGLGPVLTAAAQDHRAGVVVRPERMVHLRAILGEDGGSSKPPGSGLLSPDPRDCVQVTSHSDFTNYQNPVGQQVVVQAGFAQGESTAATYQLQPSDFPLKINTIETIFATSNSTTPTVTEWTVTIWEGTPQSGTIVAQYSSDGEVLQHLELPAGNAAGIIQFGIDPSSPSQIIVNNDGTATFSVGFRIDRHHSQAGNPCLQSPGTCCNAFPVTDTSGLASANGNWLWGLNCGANGCPPNGGWARFSQLGILCSPTGDWILRANWQPLNCTPGIGACCLPDGSCEVTAQSTCNGQGGTYQGDGIGCGGINCPQPSGACCFSSGSCLNLNEANCATAGGTWLGGGTSCTGGNCPTGACCLPSGQCVGGVTSNQCSAQGGSFQGAGTQCSGVNCPQPSGACCISNGGCLDLTEQDCGQIPQAFWAGAMTQCGPAPHAACSLCYANCDSSTIAPVLNVDDFTCFINRYAAQDPWANCDGSTVEPILNVDDFTCFINEYAAGCP